MQTADGPLRAITFAMDRKSDGYVSGLSTEEIADVLAVAVGHWGSMAEYLYNTVKHLEALGIDDRYLWRMQELVAARIEAAMPLVTVRKLVTGQASSDYPIGWVRERSRHISRQTWAPIAKAA